MQNYILYEAAGSTERIYECRYALLKYLALYNLKPPLKTTIIVQTDQPALFDDFPSYFHHFDLLECDKKGTQNKVQTIENFFASHNGNLLLCNTNTYPVQPLETVFQKIGKGQVFLYSAGAGKNPPVQELKEVLNRNAIKADGKPIQFADAGSLYSTDIIGLPSSFSASVSNTAILYDSLQAQLPKRISEEFAFSYTFHKLAPINPANEYFADYFELKEFRDLLSFFFSRNEEESVPNLVKKVHHLDARAIRQQKEKYAQLPFFTKWWNRITGKGWSVRQYQNKLS